MMSHENWLFECREKISKLQEELAPFESEEMFVLDTPGYIRTIEAEIAAYQAVIDWHQRQAGL